MNYITAAVLRQHETLAIVRLSVIGDLQSCIKYSTSKYQYQYQYQY